MTGEVSAAESNEEGLKRANKVAAARRRNPRTAREFQHQAVVPPFMDGPLIRRCMKDWDCDEGTATQYLCEAWLLS